MDLDAIKKEHAPCACNAGRTCVMCVVGAWDGVLCLKHIFGREIFLRCLEVIVEWCHGSDFRMSNITAK